MILMSKYLDIKLYLEYLILIWHKFSSDDQYIINVMFCFQKHDCGDLWW